MTRRHIILILLVVCGVFLWVLTRTSISTIQAPTTLPDSVLAPDPAPATKPDRIVVTSPLPGSTVSASSIQIKGRARGNWFFEATAPVTVVNWDGLIIGEGYIKATGEWMTAEFVPFIGTISYDASKIGAYKRGSIIMHNSNASGEPERDESLEFAIMFP